MRWRIGNAKGSGLDYIGDAEALPFSEAARELWRKYLEDASPKNAEITWDHLRVELWFDSGRIILYPAISPFRRRIEKSACQIMCPDLLNFYEMLIEADMPDEKFEEALNRKEQEIVELLSALVKEMNLPKRLGRPEVRIFYYGSDKEKPMREEILRL